MKTKLASLLAALALCLCGCSSAQLTQAKNDTSNFLEAVASIGTGVADAAGATAKASTGIVSSAVTNTLGTVSAGAALVVDGIGGFTTGLNAAATPPAKTALAFPDETPTGVMLNSGLPPGVYATPAVYHYFNVR